MKDLIAHMEWADATVWSVVLGSDDASSDEFVVDTLLHLHVTQRAFLDVWQGTPVEPLRRQDFDSAYELRRHARGNYAPIHEFFESLSLTALDGVIVIPWSKYFTGDSGTPAQPTTLGETVNQVAAHSTYHRGQVNRRLREVGAEPPTVDYIVWLWMGRPEAVWTV